jgi:hypothetical protein
MTLDLTKDEAEALSSALVIALATLADQVEYAPGSARGWVESAISRYENLLGRVERIIQRTEVFQ